jgi:hypothetical protein
MVELLIGCALYGFAGLGAGVFLGVLAAVARKVWKGLAKW